MKKSVLIFGIVCTTFSLMALGFINWNHSAPEPDRPSCSKVAMLDNDYVSDVYNQVNPDLIYDIDSRYMTTITKNDLDNATSIIDILPRKATNSADSYQAVLVSIIDDDQEKVAPGEGDLLNEVQLELLKSTDYSSNIFIKANYKIKHALTGFLEDHFLTYYMTIIPKKEAAYVGGQDALLDYLRENSREETAIIKPEHLQPGKFRFTVTKAGDITNVNLISTSGYSTVDDTLIKLIRDIPGKWRPATNAAGEKVDQELVFFFGLQGC